MMGDMFGFGLSCFALGFSCASLFIQLLRYFIEDK
jgi:hypothetical protein